jgi:hypothetical protein
MPVNKQQFRVYKQHESSLLFYLLTEPDQMNIRNI